jgi:transcriptional regulator with XRE-family HTH domain
MRLHAPGNDGIVRSEGGSPLPESTPDRFAERLTLALKALNFSRGQLAAAVGVDKSLISRWLSGQVVPSNHNLARISDVLARTKPGFNTMAWERPLDEFRSFLGVDGVRETERSEPESQSSGRALEFLSSTLSAHETAFSGHIYAGHYALFRPRFQNNGVLHLEAVSIWIENGQLRALLGDGRNRLNQYGMILRGKLWLIGEGVHGRDGLSIHILNGTGESRAMVMDGIHTSVAGDRFFTPSSTKVLMLRVGDPAAGPDTERARFERMHDRLKAITDEGSAHTLLPETYAHVVDNAEGFDGADRLDSVLRIGQEESVSQSDLEMGRYEWSAPHLASFLLGDQT